MSFKEFTRKMKLLTNFEVEEKRDTLIINKKTLLAVQPQYII